MFVRFQLTRSRLTSVLLASLMVGCGATGASTTATGGVGSAGGSPATGGASETTGGTTINNATGGDVSTGGAGPTGGAKASTGGSVANTGGRATGGAPTGGTTSTGGSPPVTCNSNVVSSGCTPGSLTQTGSLNGPYGANTFTIGDKKYYMQVNEWGSSATEVMSYGGSYFFKMTTQQASNATNSSPAGYPSMFIGANSNHNTNDPGLPKQVSQINSVLTSWTWADNGDTSDANNNLFNAAYDVWFSTNSGGEPSAAGPSGGYLMVWYYAQGCQPVGSITDAGRTIDGIPGCWDVWTGTNGGKPVISYKRQGIVQSMGYDLNLFIKDALAHYPNNMKSNWYLTNVFTGFEIWKGGVNLESTSFCAEVN